MRFATRHRLIATAVAVGLLAAPSANANTSASSQGIPPILPAPPASELGAITAAEQQEAQQFSDGKPSTGRYSNAEMNAYAAGAHPVPQAPRGGSTTSGFDYGAAGVGAGFTLGLGLVAGAGGLGIRRRRQLRHS